MRGDDPQQAAMFSYSSPEERVPPEHPLRSIRMMVDVVLKELSHQFDLLYSHTGWPRSSCCARCCCKCSTRSAVSGC
jgi:hypothetical protein